jgi:phosphoglycerate dehydrogenase-like enzyme
MGPIGKRANGADRIGLLPNLRLLVATGVRSASIDVAAANRAGVTSVTKNELFAAADVITAHDKLSERSTGLIGARELGLMRRSAFLVNTARGPIVNQDDLLAALPAGDLAALPAGDLAGAARDVYDEEPLAAGHPLRSAPRTVLTPHLGYVTDNGHRTFDGDAAADIGGGQPARVLRV